jgi:hypothetical protein
LRDFATSTQTIILALAAVFGTMAGTLVKVQRHRKKAGSDDASGSRGGYM